MSTFHQSRGPLFARKSTGRFEWGCVRWRRSGCGWPKLDWRSRPLGSAGGEGTLRGRGLRGGGRLCRRWFAELLPRFVRVDEFRMNGRGW